MNYDGPDWIPSPMQGMRGFHKDDPEWLEFQEAMRAPGPTHGGRLIPSGEFGRQATAILRRAFVNDSTKV